jgi:lysophospholipase L1-like esterase
VYRYDFDESVKFAEFSTTANNGGYSVPVQNYKNVIISYEDIMDADCTPEEYYMSISDEWRNAIREVMAPETKTMVMIGDSLTNWGGGGDNSGFLGIVHEKTGVVTSNEGTAGAWWQLMDGQSMEDITTNGVGRVNAIIADRRKYDLYCFMLGTNAGSSTDTGETSADPSTMCGAIRYCMEKLKAYDPTGQILVCLPPQRAEGNDNQEKVNAVIKTIVESYGVRTLDIYHNGGIVPNTKIADIGYLSDGLHLGENGQQVLGKALASEVKYMLCI